MSATVILRNTCFTSLTSVEMLKISRDVLKFCLDEDTGALNKCICSNWARYFHFVFQIYTHTNTQAHGHGRIHFNYAFLCSLLSHLFKMLCSFSK